LKEVDAVMERLKNNCFSGKKYSTQSYVRTEI